MSDWLVLVLWTTSPLVVYLCIKWGTVGYMRARRRSLNPKDE